MKQFPMFKKQKGWYTDDMIQDIAPRKFHVEFHDCAPQAGDTVFLFDDGAVCFRAEGDDAAFPTLGEIEKTLTREERAQIRYRYLFSIDEERFFIPDVHNTVTVRAPAGYGWQEDNMFRISGPRYLAFAGTTAHQLYLWYAAHKFCGRCGTETGHSDTERAVVCPRCGLIGYPRISPVVIVAVTDGDRLLVTRYRGRPTRRYALVAGFGEIGETLEDTARREVFEETGVHIKNLLYYKSQPWGFSSSLLSGFFCDLDGEPAITVDEQELSEALWLPRAEIPPLDNEIALTAEMMEIFREGKDRQLCSDSPYSDTAGGRR